jgi:hypothetical protein
MSRNMLKMVRAELRMRVLREIHVVIKVCDLHGHEVRHCRVMYNNETRDEA